MNTPSIPRIIHQTWKEAKLRPDYVRYRQTWLDAHPGWEYRFYDDADCRAFVANQWPEWLEIYDGYPRHIQRIDLFRYLVVYRSGGLYVDMDMECFKPVDDLLRDASCVLSIEFHCFPRNQAILGYREPFQVANCIFASVAGHPFLHHLLTLVRESASRPVSCDQNVEEITGPCIVTQAYQGLTGDVRDQVRLLPEIHLLFPTFYPNIYPINRKAYSRHCCTGTWRVDRIRRSIPELLTRCYVPPVFW